MLFFAKTWSRSPATFSAKVAPATTSTATAPQVHFRNAKPSLALIGPASMLAGIETSFAETEIFADAAVPFEFVPTPSGTNL